MLLILWRSPVAHRVELLGVSVKERHGATAYFAVACRATALLRQALFFGGFTCGLGEALGILVGYHHTIQGHGHHCRLGCHHFLLSQCALPELAMAFPHGAQQRGQTVTAATRWTRDAQLGEHLAGLVRGHVTHEVRDLACTNGRVQPPDDPGTQLEGTETLAARGRPVQVPGHRDWPRGAQIGLRLLLQALAPLLAVDHHSVGIDIVARQVCRLQLVFETSDSLPEFNLERLECHLDFCAVFITASCEQTLQFCKTGEPCKSRRGILTHGGPPWRHVFSTMSHALYQMVAHLYTAQNPSV